MGFPVLYLKKHEERRVRSGHPWVYSNEVDVGRSPLSEFPAGRVVEVRAYNGKPLGSAYVNPATLISARLFSRRPGRELSREFLEGRVRRALCRDQLRPERTRSRHGDHDRGAWGEGGVREPLDAIVLLRLSP